MEIEQLTLGDLVSKFTEEGILLGITKDKVFLTTKYEFTLGRDQAADIMKTLVKHFSRAQNYGILRSRVQIGNRNWYIEFGYKAFHAPPDLQTKSSATNQNESLTYFATAYFIEKKPEDKNVTLVIDYLRTPENETAILDLMKRVYSANIKLKTPSRTSPAH